MLALAQERAAVGRSDVVVMSDDPHVRRIFELLAAESSVRVLASAEAPVHRRRGPDPEPLR